MRDMLRNPWIRAGLALMLQVAIVMGLVFTYQATVSKGDVVYLRLRPVDPRDPLRGDFMAVAYDIGTLDAEFFADPSSFEEDPPLPRAGDTVFVPLNRVGRVWKAGAGVRRSLPAEGSSDRDLLYAPDTVFIKGSVESATSGRVRVRYGIEEYFFAEGKGATWPTTGSPEATAKVVVGPDGTAVLRQLLVNGRAWP